MILYFSGTGNSEYAAKRIGREIGDEVIDLFERIRSHDVSQMHSERPWVVVVPTYAWRIPKLVETWLEQTELTGSQKLYFVMTCGGSIGNAGKYLAALCAAKKMHFMGCAAITMPENYIALFTTPDREKALQIIGQAEPVMDQVAQWLKLGEAFPPQKPTVLDKVSSGPVNGLFYAAFVHAKKFYSTDACISCGICAKVCPTENVSLVQGKPVWGTNCTHCMACICRCPTQAIEYGKHSKGLPRYLCPKDLSE